MDTIPEDPNSLSPTLPPFGILLIHAMTSKVASFYPYLEPHCFAPKALMAYPVSRSTRTLDSLKTSCEAIIFNFLLK